MLWPTIIVSTLITIILIYFNFINYIKELEEIKQSNRFRRDYEKAQYIHHCKIKEISSKFKLEAVGVQASIEASQKNSMTLIDYKYQADMKYIEESALLKNKLSLELLEKNKDRLAKMGITPMTKDELDDYIDKKGDGPLYDECPIHPTEEEYDPECKSCHIELNEDGSPK